MMTGSDFIQQSPIHIYNHLIKELSTLSTATVSTAYMATAIHCSLQLLGGAVICIEV